MHGKELFNVNMGLLLNEPSGSDGDVINDVIENCAMIAERNTNGQGDYDVGADIAEHLRSLKVAST